MITKKYINILTDNRLFPVFYLKNINIYLTRSTL